jgi:hypothetical protein
MKSEIKYEEIIKEGEISTEKEDDNISLSQENLPIGKSIWTKIVKIKII